MTQESKKPEQTEETQEQPEPFTAQDLDAASREVGIRGALQRLLERIVGEDES